MRHYINEKLRKWLIAMVFLCGLCHTEAFAYGCDQSTQPSKSWGYQPVYNSSSVAMPTYRFHSTSVLIPTQNQSESAAWMPGNSRPRRVGGWTDEDNPVGEVDDEVDMPVGDTPWFLMLLLVAGYYLIKRYKTKKIGMI